MELGPQLEILIEYSVDGGIRDAARGLLGMPHDRGKIHPVRKQIHRPGLESRLDGIRVSAVFLVEKQNALRDDVGGVNAAFAVEFGRPDVLELAGSLPQASHGQKIFPRGVVFLDPLAVPVDDVDGPLLVGRALDVLLEQVVLVPLGLAYRQLFPEDDLFALSGRQDRFLGIIDDPRRARHDGLRISAHGNCPRSHRQRQHDKRCPHRTNLFHVGSSPPAKWPPRPKDKN